MARKRNPLVLNKREKAILKFVEKELNENGYPPSVREIGKAVGLKSTATVHAYLGRLEEIGYIARKDKKGRTLQLLKGGKPYKPHATEEKNVYANLRTFLPSATSSRPRSPSIVTQKARKSKLRFLAKAWAVIAWQAPNDARRISTGFIPVLVLSGSSKVISKPRVPAETCIPVVVLVAVTLYLLIAVPSFNTHSVIETILLVNEGAQL